MMPMEKHILCLGDSNAYGYCVEASGQFNQVDFMHLTRQGHTILARHLTKLVPSLICD